MNELKLSLEAVAYIGDDVGDIEVMKRVGYAVAVADAVDATKSGQLHYVTRSKGGVRSGPGSGRYAACGVRENISCPSTCEQWKNVRIRNPAGVTQW